ncbi:hypothetical protein FPOAC1_001283 [Fusarium poae]|uniref:hypothetical protein n=1 Tax=Fusarium poae TaxID=36050 RepID=UPI001CE852F7|nr:hypothetical protein FPOAC1_001283 [Fusarium poae]KAG8675305.1 hypothetical protein FPOAC1_001283 [Fusarium poae]
MVVKVGLGISGPACQSQRRPSPTPSTGKSLFSTNYLMLATVFSAGFAWEIGFNNVMDKVWDNNNRGRQWKDIRHKFIEGGDEDEE